MVIAERASKFVRKGTWTLMGALSPGDRHVETLLRRPPPSGYQDGELLVQQVHGPVFMEPDWGYVITSRGKLIEDSVQPNFSYKPVWRLAMPSPAYFLRNRRKEVTHYSGPVISLRHWWDWNYYHFYFDVLGKLPALEAAGIPSDVPLVIGRYYHQLPWVRELLSRGDLAKRQWIIQDDRLITADSVIYCKARITYRERAEYLVKALDAPHATEANDRRVFLGRRGSVPRQVVNLDEVVACLSSHGFEEVDAADLSIQDQMALFADTRHLVALHGAGLVNMIFRQGLPMSILELYAYNTYEFRSLSQELGYEWHGLTSRLMGPDPRSADIEVDVAALDVELQQLTSGTAR